MLRQSVIYLILSLLVVFLSAYVKLLFAYLDALYILVDQALDPLFGLSFLGELMSDVVTLMLIPLLIAALPALIYWIIKRKKMPYFIEITWFFWLILAISNYLLR